MGALQQKAVEATATWRFTNFVFFAFEMTLSASTPGFDMHQQPRCFDCVMNTVKTHVSTGT